MYVSVYYTVLTDLYRKELGGLLSTYKRYSKMRRKLTVHLNVQEGRRHKMFNFCFFSNLCMELLILDTHHMLCYTSSNVYIDYNCFLLCTYISHGCCTIRNYKLIRATCTATYTYVAFLTDTHETFPTNSNFRNFDVYLNLPYLSPYINFVYQDYNVQKYDTMICLLLITVY